MRGRVVQLEVSGSLTTRVLDNLISQTEYGLAVTPIYDEGPGQPMLGEAVTGVYDASSRVFTYLSAANRLSGDLPCIIFPVDVVPSPKNLRFSEVTETSFRATWEHGAPDVALYRIGWSKQGEGNFQYVRGKQLSNTSPFLLTHADLQECVCSCSARYCLCFLSSTFSHSVFIFQAILNNDELTYVLENLETDTPYDVSVTAIYPDESESEDLLGTERTCKTLTHN